MGASVNLLGRGNAEDDRDDAVYLGNAANQTSSRPSGANNDGEDLRGTETRCET